MNQNYWKNREEEKQRQIDIKNDTNITKKLDDLYEKLIEELNGQINEWYIKYANKNGITMAEAKRQADSLDIEKYAKLAAQYVQEKDFSEEANEQMSIYNLTMKTNRLDLLMMNMNAQMVSTTSEVEEIMEEEIAGRGYEEVERQAGILGTTVRNTAASVKTIANASFQSATWSERLWKNQDSLRKIVSKTMTNYLVKGISTNDAVRKLQGQLNKNVKNAAYCARRLVVTERQRVAKQTQMKIYEDCGIEWYEFITEPGCCPTCADLDGKKFKVKDQEAGVNVAPMHPNCRCSTAMCNDPTSDDPFDQWLEGFDEHGMTYEEWLEANGYSDETESESSTKGINKDTTIDRNYIHSSEYHRKFEQLGLSEKVANKTARESVKILDHRAGTEYEDLTLIDSVTGKALRQTQYDEYRAVRLAKAQESLLKKSEEGQFIAIHNHPGSSLPSMSDLKVATDRRYKFGLILCHNGTVIKYSPLSNLKSLKIVDNILSRVNDVYQSNDLSSEKWINALRELQDFGLTLEVL